MKITRNKIKLLVEQEMDKRSDVKRIEKKIDSFSKQLEPLFELINNRIEFEQFLKDAIRLGSKNVSGQEILLGLNNIIKELRKEVK